MLKMASFMVGALALLAGTVGCFMLAGHSPAELVWFVPSVAMILIPVGCSMLAFGFRGPLIAFGSVAAFWSPDFTRASEVRPVISAFIGYVYGAGAFVFFASLLSILCCVKVGDPMSLKPGFFGNVEGTIASMIYPVVLAEFILRPLRQRLDALSVRA